MEKINRLIVIVMIHILAFDYSYGQNENYAIFGDFETNLHHIDDWVRSEGDDALAWGPTVLESNNKYTELIVSIRWIAMHGNYFDFAVIADEIKQQNKAGNFTSLIGWTQALNGTPQANQLLNFTIQLLTENLDLNTQASVGYCCLLLLNSEIRKENTTNNQIDKIEAELGKIEKPIKMFRFSKNTLQEEFKSSIKKFRIRQMQYE